MSTLQTDKQICEACTTRDCLTRCQYLDFDLAAADAEKKRILAGEDTRVLTDCVTCYACEEYCPAGNHPFYQIVDLQEAKGIYPAPIPILKQQLRMMAPKGRISDAPLTDPVVDMCAFPMLAGCIRPPLFDGATVFSGTDVFCNIMWLHFARNSAIRDRLPAAIATMREHYLEPNNITEVICFHDECYGTYTQLAPAFGIDVPFAPIHLFAFINQRLDQMADRIRPLAKTVAYQRPCSNRLSPDSDRWLDDVFQKIGVTRAARQYDRDTPLCCGGVARAQQREELADDLQQRNIDDMVNSGAEMAVFNCPFCMFTLGEAVAAEGLMPVLVSDLVQMALT